MSNTALVIMVIVGFEAILLFFLIPVIVRSSWGDVAGKHPPVEPAPDAVRRRFQSFQCGLLSMGWCVHVATDESYLHLTPALLMRIFGTKPTSIPWEAIDRVTGKGRYRTARIGRTEIKGPAWCLALAEHGG